MIHPIPSGTRDVLPDEMRELRELSGRLRDAFERAGYGEVWTPTMEYEEVLKRGDERAAGAGYRLFDEHGQVLVLRSDSTIPIARLVATRYRDAEPPLRFCYFAHAYREVRRGSAQAREFLQGGIELIGTPGPEGDAEVVALVSAALEEAGLRRHRIGVGDGSLYRTLLAEYGVPERERMPLLERLSQRDLVGIETHVNRLGLPRPARDVLVTLPTLRGGPEVLERAADGAVAGAIESLRACHELLEQRGVAERVIFDLGLVRELGYYTGAVFEVYDPAVGFALGGGGRYDDLLGRFGRPLPACGMALDIQRVHVAQAEEERIARGEEPL
ncbi:MAG: ATP phosphoribosyltransferase regulatory subunit [Thermoleophilaceae bacterium]|nr:ATP phosphoribosyltransferase regulatory subunit [Thermoleophilaceae bacterium]